MQSKSRKSNVLKIGITGGIGSGKTVAAKIFELLGVPIYNADERAKWIQDNDPKVKEEVIKFFGKESFINGTLNRSFLAQQVFNDKVKLEKLNNIVHPRVAEDFEEWYLQKQNFPYLLKEAALFYEAGTAKDMDKMITVYAPIDLRVKRVLQRDPHRNEEDIRRIIGKQINDEEKMKNADYILYNDDTRLLIPQVVELDKIFRQ